MFPLGIEDLVEVLLDLSLAVGIVSVWVTIPWKEIHQTTRLSVKVLFHSIRASGPPRTGRRTGLARA